ncbi:MAG: 50S ribosomal protein L11 methyltransferase [Myxococcales bacterium]|nr:50S ribosomal protein L11 methyltransferase [Myxococcales bacterium]
MSQWIVFEVSLAARGAALWVERLAVSGFLEPVVIDPVESLPARDGYSARVDPDALARVEVWCDDRSRVEALEALAREATAAPFFAASARLREASEVELAVEDWRKAHLPIVVDALWRMVPHWCEAPPGEGRVIVTDPGGAFGSGDHATTRDCMRFLTELVRPGERVIDLGSGAGLLSLGAAMCGAGEVLAVDIDPMAGAHLREMMRLNGVTARVRFERKDWRATRLVGADVVIQNIGAEDAKELVLKLGATRHRPRVLLLSGIARWSLPMVAAALDETRATVRATRSEDEEWVTLAVTPRQG